jgi:hypothetical protein
LTLWFTCHHTGDKEIIITFTKNDRASCFVAINIEISFYLRGVHVFFPFPIIIIVIIIIIIIIIIISTDI